MISASFTPADARLVKNFTKTNPNIQQICITQSGKQMTKYKNRNHWIHVIGRQRATSRSRGTSPVARTSSKATTPKNSNPRPNACAAISIVFAMYEVYGIIETIPKMHAVDIACRSTLENEKPNFVIRKLVLELTQSIQHSGTQQVHEVRQNTNTCSVDPTFWKGTEAATEAARLTDPYNYAPPRGVATGPPLSVTHAHNVSRHVGKYHRIKVVCGKYQYSKRHEIPTLERSKSHPSIL